MSEWDDLLARGIEHDMSFADYRAAQGLNFSSLKKIKTSPAACWAELNRTEYTGGTGAQQFGTAAHCCVLEPDRFADEYILGADMDRRTKAYKEFVAANPGKIILPPDDYGRLIDIRDDLRGFHPGLFKGSTEVSLFWTETVDGHDIPCKARLDAVIDGLGFWDLKTCRSVQAHAFEADAMKWDYPAQLAFYARGARANGLETGEVYLAGAESTGAESRVFDMSEAMEYGDSLVADWLAQYVECDRSGKWPGLIEEPATVFRLPRWARNDDGEGGMQWA